MMGKLSSTLSFTANAEPEVVSKYVNDMIDKLKKDGILSENAHISGMYHTVDSTTDCADECPDFEDFYSTRNDELDNSVIDFIRYIADDEDINWDMSLIGDIEDYIESRLAKNNIHCCHPFMCETYSDDELTDVPCYKTNDCLYTKCPFKKVKETDNEQTNK